MKASMKSRQNSANNELYYKCMLIRRVEEKIIELYPTDKIQSPVHLSIGQEAVAVGVCDALGKNDLVFINYRGHAFYLAKGGSLERFFAELMGKYTGACKGKGGSMHLAAPEVGVMGASAVVASSIPHAVGSALANIINTKEGICVVVFGDGAMEQGVFFESINFAKLHNLPVLFICEDNGLAVHASVEQRHAFELEKLIGAYSMRYISVEEGENPYKVRAATQKALKFIQENKQPCFLRIKTFRFQEHVGPGLDWDAGYRSKDEVKEWIKRDPLQNNAILNNIDLSKIDEQIVKAVAFAENSVFPNLEEILTDVI